LSWLGRQVRERLKNPASRGSGASTGQSIWRVGALLFLLALSLRLLFWLSTPDAGWPYSAGYKGDAVTWLEQARSLQQSREFQTGLPLRPPANAYLIASVWDGTKSGVAGLRLIWCVLGALTVLVTYVAVARSFGSGPALATGLLCSGASGLLLLSTSLNNETPYLLIAMALLALWPKVSDRPGSGVLALWWTLHALACLFRVEHVLFFVPVTIYLTVIWYRKASRKNRWKTSLVRTGSGLAVFALVLVPWHLEAWSSIERFNTEPPASNSATDAVQSRIEQVIQGMTWQSEARVERDRMPSASRRASANFVAATVAVRGGNTVTAADFQILDQDFGSRPRQIKGFPFVAVYGGLNFYLANNKFADGGFTRAPLDEPPLLAGGPTAYPAALISGLPPPDLALSYPPHLDILNRGYRLGFDWIRENPKRFVALAGEKTRIFWSGAALGLTGYNLPLGLSGIRRTVDLVVPDSNAWVASWRLALLVLVLAGATTIRVRPELWPWMLFLGSKILVTIAFFGYARQGAAVIPVVALLAVLAVQTGLARFEKRVPGSWFSGQHMLRAVVIGGVLLLAIEGQRCASRPPIRIDGRAVGVVDPFPASEHRSRAIEFR